MKKTSRQPSDRQRLLAWLQTAIELELALVIVAGHEIAQRSRNRALKGAGEAAESA